VNLVQHIIVLLLAGACAAAVLWQMARTLRLGGGGFGGCCAKGCGGRTNNPAGRVVFVPAETLGRKRR
jgi:hypothetical protein